MQNRKIKKRQEIGQKSGKAKWTEGCSAQEPEI